MSIISGQQRTLLNLLALLRPHWRADRNLPARIQALLTRNRSFGSRDRRLYRELIYTTLRFLPWIEPLLAREADHAVRLIAWLGADAPATLHFRSTLVAGLPDCPASVADKVALLNGAVELRPRLPGTTFAVNADELLPLWFQQECPAAFEPLQMDALHTRAPLWLRVRPKAFEQVTSELDQLGWRWRVSPVLPSAIQVLDEADVTQSTAYTNGLIEVQDLGSQLLLESAGIAPGGRWLDACAGAGGKTLQLGQLLGPSAHVDAFDIRRSALAELATRAARANLRNVTILEKAPGGRYDGVLVDAPCSGSGTWRRAPHLKWTTTPQQVAEAARIQRDLLAASSERVSPGGRLVYATCSLNRSENEGVISEFLATHGAFVSEPPDHDFMGIARGGGLTFLPAQHNSDGFFVATLRRR